MRWYDSPRDVVNVVVVVYGPTSKISSLPVLDIAVALAECSPSEQDGGEWVFCKNV